MGNSASAKPSAVTTHEPEVEQQLGPFEVIKQARQLQWGAFFPAQVRTSNGRYYSLLTVVPETEAEGLAGKTAFQNRIRHFKNEDCNVVRVERVVKQQESWLSCSASKAFTVLLQPLKITLAEAAKNGLVNSQLKAAFLLWEILKGVSRLAKEYGLAGFQIVSEMVFLGPQEEVRVWLSPSLAENQPLLELAPLASKTSFARRRTALLRKTIALVENSCHPGPQVFRRLGASLSELDEPLDFQPVFQGISLFISQTYSYSSDPIALYLLKQSNQKKVLGNYPSSLQKTMSQQSLLSGFTQKTRTQQTFSSSKSKKTKKNKFGLLRNKTQISQSSFASPVMICGPKLVASSLMPITLNLQEGGESSCSEEVEDDLQVQAAVIVTRNAVLKAVIRASDQEQKQQQQQEQKQQQQQQQQQQ